MRIFLSIGLWWLASLTMGAQAAACSMLPDWVKPTNYELVELADAIVVAKASHQTSVLGLTDDNTVFFEVQEILKGNPPKTVQSDWARLGIFSKPSDPDQISQAHPESFSGPCSRVTFRKNRLYVLFLKKDSNGNFNVGITAFSRDREDHSVLWEKTIRYYLDIQSRFEPYQQLEFLNVEYGRLKQESDQSDELKIAQDIADHLSSLSPYKPSRFLIESYKALETGEPLPFGIRHPDANKEISEAQRLTDFLFGEEQQEFDLNAQKQSILWSLTDPGHKDDIAIEFMESLLEQQDSPQLLGPVISYMSQNGQYDRALKLANERFIPALSTIEDINLGTLLRGYYELNNNPDDYDAPKWTTSISASEWWPEFAYAINILVRERFGRDIGFSRSELEALRPLDYRDRPIIARSLAARYNEKLVVDWAEREIINLSSQNEPSASDKFTLPVELLVIDYYPERPEMFDRIFCNKDTRPALLNHWGYALDDDSDILAERLSLAIRYMTNSEKEVHIRQLKRLSGFAENDRSYKDDANGINNLFDAYVFFLEQNSDTAPESPSNYFPYIPIDCS